MAETTGKHLFVICMTTPLRYWRGYGTSDPPRPGRLLLTSLTDDLGGATPLSGLGYASTAFPERIGLVRCPLSNRNGILVLRRPGKSLGAAGLTVNRTVTAVM